MLVYRVCQKVAPKFLAIFSLAHGEPVKNLPVVVQLYPYRFTSFEFRPIYVNMYANCIIYHTLLMKIYNNSI